MFKLKGRHVRQSQVERFTRYSIRKVSFGAASVAVATGLFFLGGGSVQAAEQITNSEHTEVQNHQNLNDKSSEPSKEVAGQGSATDTQASAVETPNVVTEKVAINTASLEDLVAKAESRLSQLTEDKKTKSVIDDAKNLVHKAKELLNDDTKTQVKVDSLAKQLSSSLIILNSIKSDTTEEDKVNKNQDPRNGKEIPGKGESGFRADTYKLDDSNNAQLPDTATTGTDKFTFVALPENDPRRNSGAIAIAGGGAGDIVVNGTGEAPTDLEIDMYSSQRTGQTENPKAMSTVNGQPATSPGRMDYPLSKEQVQKLQEEAKLWVGKEKPDGNRVTTNLGAVYGSSGAYEFLATEIYKLGYEQGVDRVYIPNISNRFGVSEKATQAGWKIKSIEPSNLPPGLIYDRESDSIQGRVVANLQNGVYDFRFDVAAENERTRQIVRMKFQNLRSGWIGWQDTQPPKIEVSNDAYEATVGQNVNIEVKYSDDAGSNFSGDKRRVKYTLKDGRVVEIGNQSYRQAVSGLAGHSTTKNQGPAETSIPGVTYDLSRDKTPTEKEANGDEKIFGKGILTGSPTKAGIYTVSVFAKDYNNRNKSDTTWIHSGHEVQKYMTVVVKPTATVKNVHAYATNIPVTISEGASSAELTLPNGKVIKLEAKNGNWTLADGGAVLGPVGGEINVPVSQEDTKDAAVDTIKVKAITENVKATLLRNEIELLGDDGQKHTARLSETTGHWELEDAYKEVRTPTADGGYKLTKRQVYTEVQADGSTNYYIYSYTRTFNANDKVVSVDEVTRPKTVVPRLNTENTEGATTTVEYDAVTKEWKSSDGSNVTATKEGDFWKVRTDSGFTGLIKGSKAESVEDKGSILNDAPTATSTSYTAVKGATVDLVKQASAAVTIKDTEDDATTSPKKETTVTKVTVTSPSGQQSEYTDLEQAKAHLLSEVGPYTVKVEVKDSNGNVVTANTDTETGTDKGAETAVNSTTYTITVKDQETKKLYKVEDDTVTNDELKGKVEPTTIDGFTPTKNNFTNIPTTVGKAGQTIPTPASVTYTKGTETIPVETKVDVVVLPKVEPTGVTVLKDSTNLEEAVKAKAVEAANAIATDKIPTGVTVSIKQVKDGTLPQTTTTGVQTPAKVIVEYKDENNNVVETREVDVPVTVVSSTPSKIVVFEGKKPTADQAKAAVTPGTDGTKGEPTTLPETVGKAGATDVKVDVPVTYDNGKLTETVSVPVTVLPKASGEVEVPKGESVDKVKEVAKAKAAALVEAADFKGKLPTGATVTVGDITEAVAATLTNEKGTNKGVVNVPATYTVDGKEYPTTVPVTINVLGSEPKTVYTVEGKKPDAEKVKNAVTPGTGGTVNAPTETALPETTGKVGAKDVTVPTTVTYPNGTETVNVPVEVLPKATPEKVTTLKDTTSDNLTTAVKEKAQAALGKLTLPTGVTVELDPNQTYAVPATDSNGDKDNVPVKVQYKDATGTVVAEDTINVPVTVVGSTPSKIVVFEGEKPTADQAKAAVTPGTDGTKGEPTTLPETVGKAGATDVKVDVPVTYDNGKLTETVSVPVTVLPKASGEVEVPKGESVDKVKEVAKAKAAALVEAADFKGKLPTGATVTVGDITEAVAATLTNEKGTNKGVVNVPATYTVDGKEYPTTVPVTINVLGSEPKTVYTVEGKKPDAEKVKNAVTPGTGGTVNAPTETALPETTGKVGAKDVTVPTTVTYPNGTETVNVPVEVLPKATPEKVTTLKDTTSDNLTTAVKEKAQAALGKLTLPTGVTVELDPNQTYAVPATDSNGDKDNVPVKVQYKDATGTVVAEDTINVPVTVVGSTPSKIVVFEGEKPTADQAKAAVTPGTDGTKGEPTTLPETVGKAGATDVKVDVPVTYDNGKLTETVSVPVTVLPKASGEVEVPKGESVDKVKEVAKAKAAALVEAADFKGKLPTGATVTVGDITEAVAATLTNEKGTNKGVVNVPATYTVDGKEYPTTVPVTINVLGSEPKTVYTVEGKKPDAEKVKNAVTPGTGGTVNAPTETALPETTGKVGAKDVTVPTTVTYPNGTETVNVPVEVLPKATPEKVTTLKDTTSDNLTTAVKEKAQAALGKLTLPSGVTVELDPNQTYTVPATDSNGDKDNVPVKVQYKDATGTVVAEDTINVPVTVVSSTPSKIVVFEGDEVTADAAKGAVTPGTDGTKGTPVIPTDLTKQSGEKEVTVPVTYEGIKDPEQVKVPVTVLPKPEADEILVAKNSDKEKAKEKVLDKAKKAIEDATFKGKLPQGATVTVDETATITVPDLTEDTEVDVPVKYTVDGQEKTTTVKVPVTIVEGVPQIVPVKETNDVLPDPEKSVDKEDYPEGSTFRYKIPEGQTSPIDVTTPGDKDVIVEVLDKNGNPIVEVPATVRVVGSTPQFVVADPAKKQPEAKDSVTPGEFPEGTTFEYKTPVDTTTAGEKDVTVVAKLNGQPIVEVPAKVVVVDPKTQYVVADPSKPQPDASKSIDPEQYPDGTTFEYKTPVDTTTPGEKDVVVIAKDGEDKLVEVPTKVKVVQGNPQIVPVDEGKKQPDPEDSIDPNDYPEDATFEYKEEVDTSTPGDKKVTVVVKQGDKVLVEVPSTVRVVESYPKYVPVDPAKKQPDPKENINPNDFPTGTTFEYKDNTPVDTTTPGEKPVTVVAKLNGQPITEIPATIVVVESKTQYVPVNAENDKKPKPQDSITPDDYPEGSTFEYKTPEGQTTPYDGTTPGEKDVTVVVKDPDGDTIVEVPAKIKVVQGKEQLTPVNAEDKDKPKAEDSITPSDYPEGSTFEYKVPEGQTTPYDGTTPGDKPVTVVVKDKDGKVLVEVPANIKVVESKPTPIETPVTKTPLEKDDYTKGLNIPDGATVEVVGDLPDLTTPGEKTPVKVMITLPNGKSYTVDVPVTVTPVKEIETPVTTDKLTPEDILKQIKVPEGATTKVENIPDLTTPGKKDPVKVTVTLPNGKVVTVDVPVNVTPVKEIETPVTTTPLTPDDYTKGITIPEGGKVTKVENIPDLTTPGKKNPVKVTIELPNGKVITVDVPVTVTPVKEIETPVTTTPLTPEDYTKGIKIPEGGKVTNVANIPDLTTPGKKDPVKVTIELPNGKVITVDVPVTVTPVKEIETPVTTTPLTPEDYTKGIKIPEGGKVTNVANIPDLTTPGKKDPVKVTIELPNGKVITVDVPVTVTPVKEIETPVTTTPLTPEDYTKGIKIPEGGKVTNVANIPDLTTPGKKDPVKVTIELPNGKVITVDVPVTVTPVKEIETPVTTTPLTPEDYTKGIKIPEGGKVTNVANIPDLTTPGKKDPVKVTIELPNGKVITVDVPVTVTPVKEIETPVKEIETPVTTTPLTPEDYTKGIKIPEGGKVTNVANIPDLTTPGKKDPVKVTIELPNGKVITVDVPVTVTPVKEIETPVTTTPLTPEDYTKGIKIPEGGKVTNVANIPDLTTPGKKDPVKVTIELPNGKVITVDVPVTVTPVKEIETPVKEIETPVTTTPLTPEDYTKGIKIPEGGKVTNVANIPDLTTPGKKDPVKVTIELPNGKVITVDVPVTVTPVKEIETPVTTTPLTPEDYTKGIKIPEGGKVTNVANIPDLTTPGKKDPVKVTIELPNGKVITVDVPVTVTPVKEIETPVTTTPLTPEDYTKGIKIPEGGKVTNVANIPDLTTPGKKDPVKVTIELPNGKVITVDVPVTVTPVKEIETPVTTTPLTPEDYTKGIKIPEGGKVTNVANIPDLTTPGKKDPVKVTIELPNGKVITVDVPVTVTPVKEIETPVKEIETPVTTTPLTPEDYTKGIKIPEGGKVTNVANIPDLTTPGKKDPVKVTIELPNGKVITVDVPVTVTPVKEIETPVTTTPLTPEDYTKGIKIPEGGKVTNVANIPDLTTPGKKDPVKVTIELPNGKVITVDVPVTVTPVKEIETPVKEIETPVTTTPLTPEDYTKGIKIPEGGKVTNVANIPDLTTPGKKDPVKVTIELPNGKVITVDVPVTVTPVKEIETPVTTTPLTPEDYTKGIKIPEGGKVTNVANIPDLTTPGKKDPVKVTIELPNGKVITVDVPVTVTPVKEIETPVKEIETPVTTTPLTPEDYTKGIKIPEGGKVTNVANIPDLTTPGKKDPVKVTIELPNGKVITVDVPVTVTPVKEIETPVTTTPLTPEDYTKGIKIPEGGKVTNVANIPDLTTPGKKDPVKVTIELPNGKVITVDVPVTVTPVKEIETPVTTTPLTPEDYTKGIKIPEGGKVTNVANIPDLTTPGKKDPVKVTIELPNGKVITVDVPVTVTPVKEIETPVTTTPLTPEDYTKGIKIPEGGKVTNVANIPDLTTPGKKDPVKVTIELPNGKVITVDVPVTVTPKSQNGGGAIAQNGGSTVQIVTEYLDENGNRITSDKEGKHNPIELEGYEFSHSTTDAKGNTLHHYKKVTTPINQEQPSAPETPTSPEKPVATPVQTSSTDSKQVAETTVSNDKKELPNTGTEDKAGLASLGLLGMLGAFGLVARKKKED